MYSFKLIKNPKTKSITLLIIYMVFFVFVFSVLNNPTSKNDYDKKEYKTVELYEMMKSYNFSISIKKNDKTDIMEGTYYNSKYLFNYNSNKYYYDEELYRIDNTTYYKESINNNIIKFLSKDFISLINEMKEVSKISYEDDTKLITYSLSSLYFDNFYYNKVNDILYYVQIEFTMIQDQIEKISFTLPNLESIEIKYSNINKINDLEFNKNNYTYMEVSND